MVDESEADLALAHDALAGMRELWEVDCVSSAGAAQPLMERSAYDLVLADFRVHTPDGESLMTWVGERFPRTLRVVYSAIISQDFLLNSLKGTHLILPKPADPAVLTGTLRRALALSGWISSERVRSLVAKADALPSLPTLYFEVLRELRSKHSSVQSVADVVSRDLAITAKLLQVVNSAFYALPKRITSPGEAVAILGMETVKSVVLCSQALASIDIPRGSAFTQENLWAHSMQVAGLAKKIAWAETQDTDLADEAFTAGLLHDAGRWVMLANLGEDYAKLLQDAAVDASSLAAFEERVFGVHHGHVGAYLMGLWGMPLPVIEAAALHHTPSQGVSSHFGALTAVHVADALVRQESAGDYPFELPRLDMDYLSSFGLLDRLDGWRALLHEPDPSTLEEDELEDRARNTRPQPRMVTAAPVSPIGKAERLSRSLVPAVGFCAFALTSWLVLQIQRTATDLATPATVAETAARGVTSDEHSGEDLLTAIEAPPVRASEAKQVAAPTDPGKQAEFSRRLARLKLKVVLTQLSEPVAVIDDAPCKVGQEIDGMVLVALGSKEAVFRWGDLTNRIQLAGPGEPR